MSNDLRRARADFAATRAASRAAESELVAATGHTAREMLAAGLSHRQALQKWRNALRSIG